MEIRRAGRSNEEENKGDTVWLDGNLVGTLVIVKLIIRKKTHNHASFRSVSISTCTHSCLCVAYCINFNYLYEIVVHMITFHFVAVSFCCWLHCLH